MCKIFLMILSRQEREDSYNRVIEHDVIAYI